MKKYMSTIVIMSVCLLFVAVLAGLINSAHAGASSPHPLQILASDSRGDACNGLSQLGGTSCGGGETGISKVVAAVVNIISFFAGTIAVIMIIVSGIRYMTSGGDSAKVGAAKSALVYAIVGVVVAALAQVLVHFVIGQATK